MDKRERALGFAFGRVRNFRRGNARRLENLLKRQKGGSGFYQITGLAPLIIPRLRDRGFKSRPRNQISPSRHDRSDVTAIRKDDLPVNPAWARYMTRHSAGRRSRVAQW